MRGDGGVAAEGRLVGVPRFYSWGKSTMSLTNIKSHWMSTLPLAYVLDYVSYIIRAK